MCDVCKAEGHNFLFRNGPNKRYITTGFLYKVFKDSVAPIRLCYVHSIELFHIGERRFLHAHIIFARRLAMKSRTQQSAEESPFGL